MAKIIVRIDDVHPRMNWENFVLLAEAMTAARIPALVGVVPDCLDPHLTVKPDAVADFWDFIHHLKASGWVVAQHGCTHRYDSTARTLLRGRWQSEFAGHSLQEQMERLSTGRAILASHGLETDIFMAPGHSFDETTLVALRQTGFRYVTDGYGVWPRKMHGITLVPQLFASPHGLPIGVYTTCIHLDRMTTESVKSLAVDVRRHHVVSFYDAAFVTPVPVVDIVARALSWGAVSLRRVLRHR